MKLTMLISLQNQPNINHSAKLTHQITHIFSLPFLDKHIYSLNGHFLTRKNIKSL